MARAIKRGATYLDKMCHKLYDEPKGHGFQVDGECRHCGGHLMTYYCEDRLYLIACEKCGALALTKSAAPQVAANLTLRKPTLTPPNKWVNRDECLPEWQMDVLVRYANGEIDISWVDSVGAFQFESIYGRVTHWMPDAPSRTA